eukprot:CAMPEP_0175710612 /NCGR_PEP_ID=MMETSP0097-20121207/40171_1 /TAXON_ID=311494 /ORGANISM="Alexandrium monilatum, Strain CCMP3105" /LENGTH=618 /DNA_ID=CAMNT_0017018035 /DNA_START=12 /DNA_END=1867 /DNA_ORIENTATION=-
MAASAAEVARSAAAAAAGAARSTAAVAAAMVGERDRTTRVGEAAAAAEPVPTTEAAAVPAAATSTLAAEAGGAAAGAARSMDTAEAAVTAPAAASYDGGSGSSAAGSRPFSSPPAPPAAQASEDDRNERTIFVGGLPTEATDEDLREVFGGCGKLVNARIAMDHATGRSRGFAHLEFATTAQVEEALRKGETAEICGRRVRVDVCRPGGGGAPTRPAGGCTGGKGGGGRRGRSGSQGGSRSLAAADSARRDRSESGSRDGSGSRSASSSPNEPRKKQPRSSLFDSTAKAPEAQPPLPPLGVPTKRGRLELVAGARVDVHGLVGAAQYNGCEGRVLHGPNEKGRWEVQVAFQCEERTMSLKPENLQPKPTCGWEVAAMSLTYNASERDVSEVFATCGMVRASRMTKNQDGSSKGVCMVEMAHKSGAEAAIEKLQGHMLHGRAMKVDWSLRARQEIDAGKEKEMEDAKKQQEGQQQPQESTPEASTGLSESAPAAPASTATAPDPAAAAPGEAGNAAPAEGAPGATAATPAAEDGGSQRRRRSAWDAENSGGVVYINPAASDAAAAGAKAEPLPPESELSAMPAKELRRLLADRGVNVSTCFEKADLLEQARLLAAKAAK